MDSKIGVAKESLIVGFTAWIWLLPGSCLYASIDIERMFATAMQLNIGGGANLLAFLTFSTAIIGLVCENVSFALEKVFVGPTSSPRRWYGSRIGTLDQEHWYAAQERIWSSPQAHMEFTGNRLRVVVSRGLVINSMICLCVLGYALLSNRWMAHFSLFGWIAFIAFILSLFSWWIATVSYVATVRVAGDMQKKQRIIVSN